MTPAPRAAKGERRVQIEAFARDAGPGGFTTHGAAAHLGMRLDNAHVQLGRLARAGALVRKEGVAGLSALWVHPDHAGALPAGPVAMPAQVHAAEVLRAQQQAHRRNRAATLHSWALMGPAQPLRPLESAQEGNVRITRGAPLPDHRFCAEPGAVGGGFMAEWRARRAGGAQ